MLLQSRSVRAAARALAGLADAGQLGAVGAGALSLLREGRLLRGPGELDPDAMREVWPEGGGGGLEALGGLARLLSIGTNDAEDFVVTRGGSLPGEVEGLLRGQAARLRFRDAGAAWGPMARLQVADADVDGGPALGGCHLVAWTRGGAYQTRAELLAGGGSRRARGGDVLHLAAADRAAYLEVATFDRLALSASLLRAEDFAELELADPGEELREAMRFAEEVGGMPAEERYARRLARLAGFPIVRQALFLAEQDEDWSRVLPALRPLAAPAYEALESRLTGYWKSPTRVGPAASGAAVLAVAGLAAGLLLLVAGFLAAQQPQDGFGP